MAQQGKCFAPLLLSKGPRFCFLFLPALNVNCLFGNSWIWVRNFSAVFIFSPPVFFIVRVIASFCSPCSASNFFFPLPPLPVRGKMCGESVLLFRVLVLWACIFMDVLVSKVIYIKYIYIYIYYTQQTLEKKMYSIISVFSPLSFLLLYKLLTGGFFGCWLSVRQSLERDWQRWEDGALSVWHLAEASVHRHSFLFHARSPSHCTLRFVAFNAAAMCETGCCTAGVCVF